jgi:hypothetical protein
VSSGEQEIRIFVSSPSDTLAERSRLDRVIERLNLEFQGVHRLTAIRRESTFYEANDPFRTQIPEPWQCDIVIGIFRARLGTELPPSFPRMKNGDRYPSGPAYELLTTIDPAQDRARPDVYVFRCSQTPVIPIDDASRTEAATEWERLKIFFEAWFQTPDGRPNRTFQTFESSGDFETKIQALLRRWVDEKVGRPRGTDWRFVDAGLAMVVEEPANNSLDAVLVRNLAKARPRLVDLAALTSVAIHVEPFLLRRLRLRFLPQSDASLEADLAFSELATSNASSFELDAAFLPALRSHLLHSGWVDHARELIASSHANLSVALQVEEEVIFLTLRKPPGWETRVTELLARAAKAAESRPEIARWAFRAIQELPKETQRTDGFWLLADKTRQKTGRDLPLGPIPATAFRNLSNILSNLGPRTIEVGAARDNNDLLLTVPPTQADFIFTAPETSPIALIITCGQQTRQLNINTDTGTAFAKVSDLGFGPITVKTLDDNNYTIPDSAPPAAAAPVFQNSRDRHLFGPGPKWILSLDGGGLRGAVTLAFLERIEAVLMQRDGNDVCLGDYFDLIGGTSIGAFIAAGLALGYRTTQVKDIYLKLASVAFKSQRWRFPVLQAKFDARGMLSQIEEMVGRRTLSTSDLITGLCVITKRMDTGKPWIVANNPRAPLWESSELFPAAAASAGTSRIPLLKLIRASTAAPHFFDPELIALTENGPAIPMIDGGASPHNNPALALFQMATAKSQGLLWRTGPEHLGVISIGTGTYRPRLSYQNLGFARFAKLAFHALASLMTDLEVLVLTRMQYMGECPTPWTINSEIGSLANDAPPGGKMFRFLRYDVRLERDWLARELNYKVTDETLVRLRGMDDPEMVQEFYRIGTMAAEKQVQPEHFVGGLVAVRNSPITNQA